MSSATATPLLHSLAPASERRLWLALAASTVAHLFAFAVFAGLLLPLPLPVWITKGQPAVVQVVLMGPRPEAVAPLPEAPADAATPLPAIQPVPTPVPAPLMRRPVPDPPAPVRRSDPQPPAASETGAPTPVEPLPDAVADDTPIPPGDVAVGAIDSTAALGTTQALRLAQRFPQAVAARPRLQDPLVVPYPARAARAHREARVSALLIVDADGKVLETTLVPEDPLFGPTVRDALASARFKAAEAESRPVPYWAILEFVFTMRPTRAPRLSAAN